jgi:UDP-glucuronate 4-epimerase
MGKQNQRVLITGTAGFIGFHLAKLLLSEGYKVHGYDGITDYYDINLKVRRHEMLADMEGFSCTVGMLEDSQLIDKVFDEFMPDIVVHLAAQAGVRYSLENPRAYIDSNIIGTFNVMEASRRLGVKHLLMASTSSVYGANMEMPFEESHKADAQLTIYASTKKAMESMGHVYAHLHEMPVTMFRFFTVYGPWGRPDMALFKFTKGIFEGTPIDIYNNGDMFRDFTYVDDLVRGISLLMDSIPGGPETRVLDDSLSAAAPYRVVNIGNSDKVRLTDFIDAIEVEIGKPALRNNMGMQDGDVKATWADTSILQRLTGFRPDTDYREGVASFVSWYREYNKI